MFRSAWWAVMGVIALALLVLLVPPTIANTRYFPPDTPNVAPNDCDPTRIARYDSMMEDAQLYGPVWRAMGETALYQGVSREARVYRFTYVPSMARYHTSVRLEGDTGGGLRLVARRVFVPRRTGPPYVETLERRLSAGEVAAVEKALKAADVHNAAPLGCNRGTDGQRWIIEAVDQGRYAYVNRHSPDVGPFRTAGETMFALTGWTDEHLWRRLDDYSAR